MALPIKHLGAEPQFVAKMELLQNFFQSRFICLRCDPQVFASGLGRNIVGNGALFAPQPADSRRSAVPQAKGYGRGFQQFINEVIGLRLGMPL
jgi:hypothetical protein